jgi:Co/Zn/Cd efflux system component
MDGTQPEHSHEKPEKNPSPARKRHSRSDYLKYSVLVLIGFLTLVYSVVEIAFGLKIDSLTLLTDGFHNLSDVVAIIVALIAAYVCSSHFLSY